MVPFVPPVQYDHPYDGVCCPQENSCTLGRTAQAIHERRPTTAHKAGGLYVDAGRIHVGMNKGGVAPLKFIATLVVEKDKPYRRAAVLGARILERDPGGRGSVTAVPLIV